MIKRKFYDDTYCTNSITFIAIRKQLEGIFYSPSIAQYPKCRTANLDANFRKSIDQQLTLLTVMPGSIGWEHPEARGSAEGTYTMSLRPLA